MSPAKSAALTGATFVTGIFSARCLFSECQLSKQLTEQNSLAKQEQKEPTVLGEIKSSHLLSNPSSFIKCLCNQRRGTFNYKLRLRRFVCLFGWLVSWWHGHILLNKRQQCDRWSRLKSGTWNMLLTPSQFLALSYWFWWLQIAASAAFQKHLRQEAFLTDSDHEFSEFQMF